MPSKMKRLECTLLGKVIGTYADWDNIDDEEIGATDIFLFSTLKRNMFGKKVIPGFKDGCDLTVSLFSGNAFMFDPNAHELEGTELEIDWAFFGD